MRVFEASHYWISARFERREGSDDEAYPFNLPDVCNLDDLRFHPKVTFWWVRCGWQIDIYRGPGGSVGFNAERGSRNVHFATRASHSELHRSIRPVRSAKRASDGFFLRAESMCNVATQVEQIGVRGYRPLPSHSGVPQRPPNHAEDAA